MTSNSLNDLLGLCAFSLTSIIILEHLPVNSILITHNQYLSLISITDPQTKSQYSEITATNTSITTNNITECHE